MAKQIINLNESDIAKMVKNVLTEIDKINIKERWDKEKKYYFSIEEKANNKDENVLKRYYNIDCNEYRPVLLKETTLQRILDKHGDNGFVCVSANRRDESPEINDRNTRELIQDIKNTGYSYLPTYGGYRNKDTGLMDDFEPSFLIFNYNEYGEKGVFEKLRNFALEMCGKYDQHSVMIKYPNAAPTWEDKNGNVVSNRSSEKYWKNNPEKECFTSLQSKEDIENKEQYTNKRTHKTKYPISKRFTYDIDELYVNPLPMNLLEEQRRKGEIMIWRV